MGDMTTAAPAEDPRRSAARKASPWIERHAQEITALLIKQLRDGTAPWQKPWAPGERALPCNLASGRDYSGFNAITLAATAQARGYSAPWWGTYRQIAQAGGQVRKGEKGTGIVVVKYRGQKLVTDGTGKPILSPEGKKMYRTFPLKQPFTRGYTVFNAEQAKGFSVPSRTAQTHDWNPVEKADALLRESGVKIVYQSGDRAYYCVARDRITLPERHQFTSTIGFYQTALHELGHATGHPSRMDRKLVTRHDTPEYAREELRAEICAMLTGTRIGVGHDPSGGAAYVQSWIKQLQRQPMEIHAAASEAGRMSRYIMEMGRGIARDMGIPSAAPTTGVLRRRLRMDKGGGLEI